MRYADFEYIGAGSNRNFSFTDLLLRERCNTDVKHLSTANWGIIEVKGAWQLSLPDNMSLGEALDHPDYCEKVLPALQQVCMLVNAVRYLCCSAAIKSLGFLFCNT